MPRSTSLKSILFVATDNEWYAVDQSKTEIYVGIWWHHEQKLIGFAQPITAIQEPRTLIDSDLTHADAWDFARRQLSCPSDVEYFAIPRGRNWMFQDRCTDLLISCQSERGWHVP